MSDARWRRVQELFEAALGRPACERRDLLARVCEGDETLLREVESLLAAAGSGPVDEIATWLDPVHRKLGEETPPRALGHYEIERELGRGGMGIVYLARDPRLDRPVAIKVLYPHLASDEEMTSRFVAEARAASSLDHRHVCTIHDLGRLADGRFYIAMAYYPGGSLADRVASGPMPLEEVFRITRQVADGLHRTHEARLVHRDVKPANIAFSADGDAKILDFGVAKLASSARTLPGLVMGTPRYTAPEQLRGEDVDRRADVWSLAAVIYEMLAGRPAFDGEGLERVRRQVLMEEPRDLREVRTDVPERLHRVIGRALAKEPDDRPPTARELADQLEETDTRLEIPRRWSSRLPAPSTRFLGRDREIGQVLDLLQRARLVTLTGPGGSGKTRLALEAAHRLSESGVEVHFVPLMDLREPGLVIATVAGALEIETGGARDPLDSVAVHLGRRRVLLVLDNLEHLPEAAPAVAELLRRCPGVTVLTTSRGPLRLTAEHELPVPPLATTARSGGAQDEPSAAAQLFLDRARAAVPSLDLDAKSLETVDEICRRLDGLPLALELAAPRMRLFSPDQLLEQLRDHIDLPGRGPQDHPDRHRTLSQAIDWSYELLCEEHRRLFRSLSVFRGGFTLEQGAAVTGFDLDALAEGIDALLDQSLVVRKDSGPDAPRFGMLETLRAYAAARLGESGERLEVRRSHRRFFLALADEAAPHIEAGSQRHWLERLAVEHDNLRAALDEDEGPEETSADARERLRLAATLWRFWIARGHFREGLERLESLLSSVSDGEPGVRIRALVGAATLSHNVGRHARARELLAEAGDLCRERNDDSSLLHVLNNLAWVALENSDLREAEARALEGLELARRLGDRRAEAVALNNLGFLAAYRGEWDDAAERHRDSCELRRTVGDRRGEGFAEINLSWAERERGELVSAERHLAAAEEILAALDDRTFTLWATCHRVALALARGEPERVSIPHNVLEQARELGNLSMVAELLYWRARTASAREEPEEAARLAGESFDICKGYGWRWGSARSALLLGRLAMKRGLPREAGLWWGRAREAAETAGLATMAERAHGELDRLSEEPER